MGTFKGTVCNCLIYSYKCGIRGLKTETKKLNILHDTCQNEVGEEVGIRQVRKYGVLERKIRPKLYAKLYYCLPTIPDETHTISRSLCHLPPELLL